MDRDKKRVDAASEDSWPSDKGSEQESRFPDSKTFSEALGQVVWLMTVSKEHRDLPISEIERRVSPAILLRQFRIYLKGKQPIAFIAWAAASDGVKAKIVRGEALGLHDWRSGENVVVVECVSPFAQSSKIVDQFLAELPHKKNP